MGTLPPSAGLLYANAGNTVRDRMVRDDDRFLWYGQNRPSAAFRRRHSGYRFTRPGSGPFQGYWLGSKKKTPKKQSTARPKKGKRPDPRAAWCIAWRAEVRKYDPMNRNDAVLRRGKLNRPLA